MQYTVASSKLVETWEAWEREEEEGKDEEEEEDGSCAGGGTAGPTGNIAAQQQALSM